MSIEENQKFIDKNFNHIDTISLRSYNYDPMFQVIAKNAWHIFNADLIENMVVNKTHKIYYKYHKFHIVHLVRVIFNIDKNVIRVYGRLGFKDRIRKIIETKVATKINAAIAQFYDIDFKPYKFEKFYNFPKIPKINKGWSGHSASSIHYSRRAELIEFYMVDNNKIYDVHHKSGTLMALFAIDSSFLILSDGKTYYNIDTENSFYHIVANAFNSHQNIPKPHEITLINRPQKLDMGHRDVIRHNLDYVMKTHLQGEK